MEIKHKIFSAILLLSLMLSLFLPITVSAAATTAYTTVLEDLTKDSSFNVNNYPANTSDMSVKLIQIAEGEGGELFVYVYQPAVNYDFRANYISISRETNDLIDPTIYPLTFCNSQGTLYKYLVDGFTVNPDDDIRYYEIYEIFRPFNKEIDDEAKYNNKINSMTFSVSKQWRFGTINGNSYVNCYDIETIEITDKYVGYCRYYEGYDMLSYPVFTDSHFVAFKANRDIEELYEADVYFRTQSYEIKDVKETWGDPVPHEVTVYDTKYVESTSDKFLAEEYKYAQIQSITEFRDSEIVSDRETYLWNENAFVNIVDNQSSDLTATCKEALLNQQWVLRFYESSFVDNSNVPAGVYWIQSTAVSDVTILRLKFKTNGVVYNLGVIDNMQTGGSAPSNKVTHDLNVELSEDFSEFLKIMLIIVGTIALIALSPIVLKVISVIFKILFAPFKALFGSKSHSRKR